MFEGAGLDGVVAKPADAPYSPDKRTMFKVKHERTADCVVAGFRLAQERPGASARSCWAFTATAGRCSTSACRASFPMRRRAELVEELAPYRMDDPAGHPWQAWAEAEAHAGARLPGAVSPMECEEGPVVDAAAARAGRRGGLRPHGR